MMGSEGSTSPAAAGACAVCGGAAAVYCPADAAALCGPCDAAVHAANPLASRHERVPLAAAVAAASGVYDDLFAADDVDAASSWPAPPPAQAQAQGRPHGSSSASFTTSDSGADGGGGSLFDLLSDVDLAAACVTGGHLPQPDGLAPVHHGAAPPFWAHPGLDAWMAAWPQAGAAAVVVPATAFVVAAAAEREARVQRYREKRKNRRFQKTIRYASRKAYAEARPRIKGRFVKRAPGAAATSSDDDATAAGSGAADAGDTAKFWLSFSDAARDDGVGFYVDAAAYGVVPSF